MLNLINQKNLKLNNIEFLCLKMASHPGMPGRWYLRQLHQYRFGTPGTGSWNALYLSPTGKYRGILFMDLAPKARTANGVFTQTCSKIGSFRLTPAGLDVASRARSKIGL
jgi:hypothetical protein